MFYVLRVNIVWLVQHNSLVIVMRDMFVLLVLILQHLLIILTGKKSQKSMKRWIMVLVQLVTSVHTVLAILENALLELTKTKQVKQIVKIVTHIITVPLLDWKNLMKSVLLASSALKQLFSRNLMIMQLVESVEKVNIVFKELNTIVNQVLMLQYLD